MKPITIQAIHLHPIALPFVEMLRTSFGQDPFKAAVLVEVVATNGITGWGEISVEIEQARRAETVGTAQHIANNFLIRSWSGRSSTTCASSQADAAHARQQPHQPGLESGYLGRAGAGERHAPRRPVRQLPAGRQQIARESHRRRQHRYQPSVEATVAIIEALQPGLPARQAEDSARLGRGAGARRCRAALPDITLMLDANSAYTLADTDHLAELDAFNLLMIEQPLGDDDIYEHSKCSRA
ncbi:MAG: enolase C-terminal domain-like protein [Anaerolineae bacterium]